MRLTITFVFMVAGLILATTASAAPPTVERVETVGDGAGNIQALNITFSEPIDRRSIAPGDFAFTGCTCAAVTVHDDVETDRYLQLNFTPEGTTALRPSVKYTGTQVVARSDAAGAPSFGPLQADDGAPPVLLSVVSTGVAWTPTNATITFSEPVYWIHNPHDPLGRELFTYTDVKAGGSTGVLSSAKQATPGKDVWWLELDGATQAADGGNDTVRTMHRDNGVVEVSDVVGNLAVPAAVKLQLDEAPPAKVTDLSSKRVAGGIELTWTAPPDLDQTRYEVRHAAKKFMADGSDFTSGTSTTVLLPRPDPGQQQTVLLDDLPAETQVHIALRSVDRNSNWSPVSNVVSNTTQLDSAPPARITDLAFDAAKRTETRLDLSWTTPEDKGSGVASYILYVREGGLTEADKTSATNPSPPSPAAPGVKQTHVLSLAVGKTYGIAIAAVDALGNVASLSNVLTVAMAHDTTPPTGGLAVVSTTHHANASTPKADATFMWSLAAEPDTPGSLTHTFRLEVQDSTFSVPAITGQGSGTAVVTLMHNGHWCFTATARSDGGSVNSAPHCFRFTGGTPPPVAQPVLTDGKIRFMSPGDATVGITGFDVRHRLAGSGTSFDDARPLATPAAAPAGHNVTMELPVLNGTREFAVRALGNGTQGPWSPTVSVFFSNDTTPPRGVLAAAAEVRNGVVHVSWTAVKDNESAVAYVVLVHDIERARTNATTIDIEGLSTGAHTILVRALSAGGTGPEQEVRVTVADQVQSPAETADEESAPLEQQEATAAVADTRGMVHLVGIALGGVAVAGGGAGALVFLRRGRSDRPRRHKRGLGRDRVRDDGPKGTHTNSMSPRDRIHLADVVELAGDSPERGAGKGDLDDPLEQEADRSDAPDDLEHSDIWTDNGDHPLPEAGLCIECPSCGDRFDVEGDPPFETDCLACDEVLLVEA